MIFSASVAVTIPLSLWYTHKISNFQYFIPWTIVQNLFPIKDVSNFYRVFCAVTEILETILLYKNTPIQISKLQTQNKELSGSRDHIMWDHVVSGDDVGKMDFWNSTRWHPKQSLSSQIHQVFKTQHRLSCPKNQVLEPQHILSRWPVITKSCLPPDRLSRQKVLFLSGPSMATWTNHIFPTFLPLILKNFMTD